MWAPKAEMVALELDGRRQALAPVRDGWFTARIEAGEGQRYAYVLDGGPARPDPASRRQPDGVHQASALFDANLADWHDHGWRAPSVGAGAVYELHVGTFTPEGTFDAAREHLEDLVALGVTHVEIMPVNAFNGERGWGYDGVGWYAVHEPYGGPAGLVRFVDACHRAGLAVILDVVYNHFGPSGNYLDEYGPYLTVRHTTPWGGAVNLDGEGSDGVRAFIVGSALSWFADFHIDALRLDAVPFLIDTSAVHILAELSAATADLAAWLGRPLQLIAESDRNNPLMIRPREAGGLGIDALWADDLHHGLHVALTGERDGYYVDYQGLVDVARAYRRGFVYAGRYSRYRQRTVGAPLPDDVPGHRLVACLQNHDQIGNRAHGERLTTLADDALVQCAILLLCAAPSVPLLFMGEEYGETAPFQFFTSHPEPELAAAVRDGRRREFAAFGSFAGAVPDPQATATWERSVLDRVRAATPAGRARRRLWSHLLRLRRSHAALANGRRDLVRILAVTPRTFAAVRADPHEPPVLIVANLGVQAASLPRPDGDWALILATGEPRYGGGAASEVKVGAGAVKIGAHCAALLAAQK